MIFILIAFSIFCMVLFVRAIGNYCINKAVHLYVLPCLKEKNKEYARIEKIPFQFTPFKKKGDFENEVITTPFYDTNFNRKVYCYLYYKDNEGCVHKTTMKIYTNMVTFPVKVEYYPHIE